MTQTRRSPPGVVIEQAKDILMSRRRCTADDAVVLLRSAATRNDLTVDELAGCIVEAAQRA
jgi:AmiR/NasT family two-component response regulator